MKTNEAPEKLYFGEVDKGILDIYSDRESNDEIEYIRIDVFIKKAAEWLNNFYNEDTHSYLIDEDIEKFINYMKGE